MLGIFHDHVCFPYLLVLSGKQREHLPLTIAIKYIMDCKMRIERKESVGRAYIQIHRYGVSIKQHGS